MNKGLNSLLKGWVLHVETPK